MFCNDPSLTLLAKYGYNVVRLPRTGIEPLDVIGRDRNGIEPLGRLPTVWHSKADVPVIEGGDVAAEIKTIRTASLKISLGLKVLGDILGALGASIPRLDFAYGNMESLQFSFGDIKISKVAPFEVGAYLKKGDLQVGNPWVERYLQEDDVDAFVITEVLKSDAVSVIVSTKGSSGAGIDLTAIQKAVGAEVKVEAESGTNSAVTYKGKTHLTFGFKAFRIGYDFNENGIGEWEITGIDPKKGNVYLDASQQAVSSVLFAERDGRVGRVNLH